MKKTLAMITAIATLAILSGCGGGGGGGTSGVSPAVKSGLGRAAVELHFPSRSAGRETGATTTGTVNIVVTITGDSSETGAAFPPVTATAQIDAAGGSGKVSMLDVPIGVNHLMTALATWPDGDTDTIKYIISEIREGELSRGAADPRTTVIADAAIALAERDKTKLSKVPQNDIAEIAAVVDEFLAAGYGYDEININNVLDYETTGDVLAGIEVSPATATLLVGGAAQFTATPKNAYGMAIAGTVTWSVEGDIGAVDSNGLFTASDAGTGTVVAALGAISGSAEVTVEEIPAPAAVCGNGALESGEECDDGNTATEACTYGQTSCSVCDPTCKNAAGATSYCGDSVTGSANSEQCDDGNTASGDGCSATCQTEAAAPVCGNGSLESGEQCDDGNTATETCTYGQTSCTVCGSTCQNAAGSLTGYCGDGAKNGSETCDDGSNNGKPNYCGDTCAGNVPTTCGNSVVESGEACDDGNTATEACTYGQTSCTVCGSTCQNAAGAVSYCGDGVKNGSETCDDGANNGQTNKCNTTCDGTTSAIVCNTAADCGTPPDHMQYTCANPGTVAAVCNLGLCVPQCLTDIDCNDNNPLTLDTCLTSICDSMCYHEALACGDGVVGSGETCDDGANNGQPNKCNTMCDGTVPAATFSVSGSVYCTSPGTPLSGATVSASSGGSATTDASGNYVLTNLPAGTFILTASEPEHATSTQTVTLQDSDIAGINFTLSMPAGAVCGNGAVESGEACDDGNTATEACEYGQTSCTVCTSTCQTAAGAASYCGDGAKNGSEACDDGSDNGQPNFCNSTCDGTAASVCGNSFVESGETCDDGNTATETCAYGETSCTVCNSACQSEAGAASYCGDGVKNGAENCDDGENNGGENYCSTTCENVCKKFTKNFIGGYDGWTTLSGSFAVTGTGVQANTDFGSNELTIENSDFNVTDLKMTLIGNLGNTWCQDIGVGLRNAGSVTLAGDITACDYGGEYWVRVVDGENTTQSPWVSDTGQHTMEVMFRDGLLSADLDNAPKIEPYDPVSVGDRLTADQIYIGGWRDGAPGQIWTAIELKVDEGCAYTYYCGDGMINDGETCDDGNTVTEACAYGETSCSVCDSTCQTAVGAATGWCGDETVQSSDGETCDDGNGSNDDWCSSTCQWNNPWVPIPAGDFVMGCATADGSCNPSESPKHTVTMSQYKIQKYEVTNAQYKACVDTSACTAPSSVNSYTHTPYYGDAAYDNYPVVFVDWAQAGAYCAWAGGRLPTEAEWEKAARGPSPREPIYPWGDAAVNCALANSYPNVYCFGDTAEVGSYPSGASYYGVMDMAGNAWEWVSDWYASDYFTTGGPTWNSPQGPESGTYKVVRGGAFGNLPAVLRASDRSNTDPAYTSDGSGFRCAQGALCGNSVVESGEACDDGNFTTEDCAYGEQSCSVCDATCQSGPGVPIGWCGDETVQSGNGEICDDGNAVTESCIYGDTSCSVCNSTCQTAAGATTGWCGDGTVNGPEACDDGNTTTENCFYGETSCTVCDSTCQSDAGATIGWCGDGTVESFYGETCDDNNTVGGDGCNSVCLEEIANEWLNVPSGNYVIGCATGDSYCNSNESPKHTATLAAFDIQRYEVTNAQYKECVGASACGAPMLPDSATRNPYFNNPLYDNFPVISVNWDMANTYCTWIGGRLPTEAEWEAAARGSAPAEPVYPWGDSTYNCTLANYNGCSNDTSEVGSHPTGISPFGAEDMAGNVWEWVSDWYDPAYYTSSPPSDPQGPGSGSDRVVRGGTWTMGFTIMRASARWNIPPSNGSNAIGIRCARTFGGA